MYMKETVEIEVSELPYTLLSNDNEMQKVVLLRTLYM